MMFQKEKRGKTFYSEGSKMWNNVQFNEHSCETWDSSSVSCGDFWSGSVFVAYSLVQTQHRTPSLLVCCVLCCLHMLNLQYLQSLASIQHQTLIQVKPGQLKDALNWKDRTCHCSFGALVLE